ncbi:MAG TPA: M20/M25/M40 family metallo-hydrolase [Gemmataceae bacterium]|jgi:tripeptide aminopeptidase|nr:M20/M25/M40 family metallo-hydrolase [Gemmataceae bacterium]
MIDPTFATDLLLRLLAIEGVTGREKNIARALQAALKEAGVAPRHVRYDDANARIPVPTQTGNLIAELPGTKPGPRLLFMTHMDTVPLCAGAVPVRKGNKIVPQGETALGGDNRTGCAVLVNLIATLVKNELPHPPLTFLFTVREESGLFGARHLDPAVLGGPAMGFNFDGRSASDITVGAVGADRWEVEIRGKASHAGVYPERGVSATLIAALALAEVHAGGWFGKVVKDGRAGTSNVGSFGDAQGRSAGEATNVVTDFVHIKGESRSHDPKFFREITTAYKTAFTTAAQKVTDHEGKPGKVKFTSRTDYFPFRLKDDAPVVKRAMEAVKAIGREPTTKVTNGGLDANWIVKHGIPTVTLGAGQNDIHTVKEWVDVPEFLEGCKLAVALAQAG